MSALKRKDAARKPRTGKKGVAGPKDFNRRAVKSVLYNRVPQFPDEWDTEIVSGFQIANAGATASVTGFLASNCLLTSSHSNVTVSQPTNLDNWSALYESYRVVAYEVEYFWVSRSTSDSNFSMVHTNEDPGFATGSSWVGGLSITFPHVFHILVPGTGKSPCTGRVRAPKIWLAEIVGSDTFATDDGYAGTISNAGVFTAPAVLTYVAYHAGIAPSGTYSADTSPYCYGRFRQWVKFYGRRA